MKNKVTLVTDPDDVYYDAFRILAVDLDQIYSKILSDSLLHIENVPETVIYVWNGNNLNWLFDKKHKSQLILFNANTDKQELAGYFAAQHNSHYFGTLRSLENINTKTIYDIQDLTQLLGEYFTNYA